ncbi:MAG: histidine kinase [Gammaproteobacteria bacterium HGW-Gammaproteobacteria-3]|nr:MAG: histidine kinase [Gammaproteobacteria bacterium HGW-Gammaproteobacteria-3]
MAFWNFLKKKEKSAASTSLAQTQIDNSPDNNDKLVATRPITLPIAFLKRLVPIAQLLVEEEIQQLSIRTANFSAGSIIFSRGSEVGALAYIVKGSVFMETHNNSGQEITAGTLKALYPLATGQFHPMTAIAKTHVTLIYVPQDVLRFNRPTVNPLYDTWQVSDALQKNPFYQRFYQHCTQQELAIPSFPDIALKLRRAIQQEQGIAHLIKIINLDPAIAAKLIQVANSPIYRTIEPITNCHSAINRIGLTTTRNLVTAISMKNLFKSTQPELKKRFQNTWIQSVRISSISHTLAGLNGQVAPEQALLAGLLHNIGTLPLLKFADGLSADSYTFADIDQCLDELQAPLGSVILEKWDFPDGFKNIPLQSNHWFENTGPELNLTDIVLLAKFHNLLATSGGADLPLISTLPAFQKLKHQLLTAEMSLQILQDAKQQIAETIKFFAA